MHVASSAPAGARAGRGRDPFVGAYMENARGPTQGCQEHQSVSNDRVVIAPIEGRGIEQEKEAGQADEEADHARWRQRLAQEYACSSGYPQRSGVTKNDRASGRTNCSPTLISPVNATM